MAPYDRKEALRIAAEKIKRKKEEERIKEKMYFEKITSGKPWMFFKIIVAFCTLMVVLTTIEIFVDGNSKKLEKDEWKIDRELYLSGHQSIKVGENLFVASFKNWLDHIDDSFKIVYSPIFKTGKKLRYKQKINEETTVEREVIRRRSIFTWFPYFQIMMLIPLLTFIFKAQKPMFYFARVASMLLIFPGTILVLFLTLL